MDVLGLDALGLGVLGLEMYGTQQVKVKLLFAPHKVTSDNSKLKIKDWHYKPPFIHMRVHGQNIQGEAGVLTINP